MWHGLLLGWLIMTLYAHNHAVRLVLVADVDVSLMEAGNQFCHIQANA